MSDPIRCEVCGKTGQRRVMKHCPEGWFYGEVIDDEDSPLVVVACSVECSQRFWLPGPGDLFTSPDYAVKP